MRKGSGVAIEQDQQEPGEGLTRQEMARIVFSCLRLAARQAGEAQLTLAQLRELMELSYFQQARDSGLKMRSISSRFEVGMTKVAELSKDLKDHFLLPEREHGIARQILSLLWAGPLTQVRIGNELPTFDDDAVKEALDQLLAEGRIESIKGRTERFGLSKSIQRLSVVPWMAQIDGLNTLMDHAFLAIKARLVRKDTRAQVRNLAFRVREEDMPELVAFYEKELLPLVCRLDERAQEAEESSSMKLSVLWAPEEPES